MDGFMSLLEKWLPYVFFGGAFVVGFIVGFAVGKAL